MVAQFFDEFAFRCTNCRALCDINSSLENEKLCEHENALEGICATQAEKDMALAICAMSRQFWTVQKPKLTLHAVSDCDG